ncbi:MAG: 50S ribosomal protein L29 [Tunicatimonas sp.]
MKNSEIRSMSDSELRERIQTEQESLTKLRFSHAVTPIENPSRIRVMRKTVARLKTELRAKELAKS